MTFAQALARIDALNYQLQCIEHAPYWAKAQRELEYLMVFHADSIVQLAKVAETLRTAEYAREISAANAAYDKLMKGE